VKFWIQFLKNFYTFNIVEEGADATLDDVDQNADEDTSDNDEALTPAEAALAEMGLDGDEQEALAEVEAELTEDAEVAEETVEEAEEAAEAAPAAEEKAITDDDLKPLETKSKATNERFHKITEGYKQEKTRADELEGKVQHYEQSLNALRDLGFNDETAGNDLVEFAGFRHTLASGDVNAFAEIIGNQIKNFEAMHGKKVTINASLLGDFPELQEKVNNLELDEDTALEVARARAIQNRTNRQNTQQVEVRNQEAAHEAAIAQATNDVVTLQENWQKHDPDYAAILPYLQEQLPEIGKNFPPTQWAKTLDIQYKSLKKALSEQAKTTRNHVPLRGNGHQAGKAAPSSPAEAAMQAIGLA
jgi:hypothetical protein